MFDSVRVRLTLLYTGVLALILIFLSVGTYWLVALTMERRTYISMAEISQGFLATLTCWRKTRRCLRRRSQPEPLRNPRSPPKFSAISRDEDELGPLEARNQKSPPKFCGN